VVSGRGACGLWREAWGLGIEAWELSQGRGSVLARGAREVLVVEHAAGELKASYAATPQNFLVLLPKVTALAVR